jgi:hypothetical protein
VMYHPEQPALSRRSSSAQKAKSDFLLFCASARAASSGTCSSRRDPERESTLSGGGVLGPCADRYCIYDIFLRRRAQWSRVCATESRFYCTLRHCPQRDEMKLITAAFCVGLSFQPLLNSDDSGLKFTNPSDSKKWR